MMWFGTVERKESPIPSRLGCFQTDTAQLATRSSLCIYKCEARNTPVVNCVYEVWPRRKIPIFFLYICQLKGYHLVMVHTLDNCSFVEGSRISPPWRKTFGDLFAAKRSKEKSAGVRPDVIDSRATWLLGSVWKHWRICCSKVNNTVPGFEVLPSIFSEDECTLTKRALSIYQNQSKWSIVYVICVHLYEIVTFSMKFWNICYTSTKMVIHNCHNCW